MKPLLLTVLLVYIPSTVTATSKSRVRLEDNRYTGLVIAINPEIEENAAILSGIKEYWTKASAILCAASRHRAYFGDITILVPKTWKSYSDIPTATIETYDKADVLIAKPNPSYGSMPYTQQHEGCGSPGSYIHLTDDYLVNKTDNFGDPGKVLVHEWAHYRWGVFDETSTSHPFYFHGKDQKITNTQCPADIPVCCFENSTSKELCNGDPQSQYFCDIDETGRYSPSCVCYVKNETTTQTGSIMTYQHVQSITAFCDDDPESKQPHNKEAVNEQNRLCDSKSAWEVILKSEDFSGNQNVPNPEVSNTNPTFTIKKAPDVQRFVILFDVSGSMMDLGNSSETRLEQARKAAYYFIMNAAPEGSYVGIVEFETTARRISSLVQLNSVTDRLSLVSMLPRRADGGTCIGCGIREGIKVLEEGGLKSAGDYLLIMTDGEENQTPFVKNTYYEVIDKKIIVKSLIVYTDGNDIVGKLSRESGGDWFFAGSHDLLDMIDAFNQMAEVHDGDKTRKNIEIISDTVELSGHKTHTWKYPIDSTVGNNTVLTFTWSVGSIPPTIVIKSPSGKCIISESSNCFKNDTNADFKTMILTIPGTAEPGWWTGQMSLSTDDPQTVVMLVTSMVVDANVDPIVVEATMNEAGTAIYARVSQGTNPVLGAEVFATISSNDKASKTKLLLDKGADPDIRRNDGIYSGYIFGAVSKPGKYSVKVTAVSPTKTTEETVYTFYYAAATYVPGYVNKEGAVITNSNGPTWKEDGSFGISARKLGSFNRQTIAGAFEYAPPSLPNGTTIDGYSPSRVLDLVASQRDFSDFRKGIVLSFRAPGDDYDSGRASQYEIRYSTGELDDFNNNFGLHELVEKDDVLEGDIFSPQSAGQLERIVVKPRISIFESNGPIRIMFALRATDADNNIAGVSNTAILRFHVAPPAFAISSSMRPTTSTSELTTVQETTTIAETTSSPEPSSESQDTTTRELLNKSRPTAQSSVGVKLTTSSETDITLVLANNLTSNSSKSTTLPPVTVTTPSDSSSPCPDCATKEPEKQEKSLNCHCLLHITVAVVIFALGCTIGISIWAKRPSSNRWDILSSKSFGSAGPSTIQIEDMEKGVACITDSEYPISVPPWRPRSKLAWS